MREAYPEDQVHILLAKSNADSFTYDGIELGGERTTAEIEDKIKELEENGTELKKLSVIGYSLGGLVARYTIGLLFSRGLFDRIQPVNFTTFATPHLGVRTPLLGPHSYIFNVLGARTLSQSGRQLFLIDSFRDTNRPLLSVMADPNSIFIRALSQFKNRTLYCNIVNDKSVPWYTSSVTKTDPFIDLDAVELRPLKGYEGALLDPDEPVRPKTMPQLGLLQRLQMSGRATLSALPFVLLLSVVIPIGSTVFLINSGYQTFRSAQRVRLHESGQAGVGIEHYRIPLIEEARSLGDRVYRRLGHEQGEDYLPTPPPEEEIESKEARAEARAVNSHDKFPTLALTPEQFEMIENLDRVGLKKYPVHITKVRHSHAAIVVRSKLREKWFSEGKVVVRHWVEHFEV